METAGLALCGLRRRVCSGFLTVAWRHLPFSWVSAKAFLLCRPARPDPLVHSGTRDAGWAALLQDNLTLSGHTVCCCYLLTESCKTLSQPHGLQPPSSLVRDFS